MLELNWIPIAFNWGLLAGVLLFLILFYEISRLR